MEHKKEGMLNIKDKKCKTPYCGIVVRDKYKGYCLRCFVHIHPDEPVSRNYKTKEKAVSVFLDKDDTVTWVTDKRIEGGCSKKRPDKLVDCGTHVVIVEIDENQHTHYDCSCENKRLMELSRDLNHRPIVFIRFNPDGYVEGGKKISGCWSVNNKGIAHVPVKKASQWERRLQKLDETVKYWIKNPTDKTIELVHLFYDS
jgi:hypothetical protein